MNITNTSLRRKSIELKLYISVLKFNFYCLGALGIHLSPCSIIRALCALMDNLYIDPTICIVSEM